jgi:DNA-binding IclR family transcriptional regulator
MRAIIDPLKDQVRAQGYATALGELEDRYNAIGVPVRDHDRRVTAAVSIGGPGARLTLERLRDRLPPLRRAADGISRRLGYTG